MAHRLTQHRRGEQRASNASRRQVVCGLAATSAFVLAGGGRSAPVQAQPTDDTALRSGDFGSFREAVEAWSRAGGTLIVTADHFERAPITMNCEPGRSYRLTSEGARTISYAGPQYHWLFCAYSSGRNPFAVDGDLTFDGRNNCCIPFFARFEDVEGSARRDFNVSGLTARNGRVKRGRSPIDGSPTNSYGAAGMMFMGGFNHLVLSGVRAFDITREAGAGRTGSQGCVGIGVVAILPTTRSAKRVRVEDFLIANVDSDDAPGTPEREDMDGLLIFQSAEADGSRPLVRGGEISEAAGRAVKIYAPGGGGTTRDLTIRRSVHGKTNGSNDVAHQHGDGAIENIVFQYSGNAHSQPTVPVGMSSGTSRPADFPFSAGVIRNIRIEDTTGRAKEAIVSMFYSPADSAPRRYLIDHVSDTGSARHLFIPGGLGSYGPAEIALQDITVDLTRGLFATEDRSRMLRVVAHGVQNRGRRPVPFKVFYDGRPAPPGHGGVWAHDATVRGIEG